MKSFRKAGLGFTCVTNSYISASETDIFKSDIALFYAISKRFPNRFCSVNICKQVVLYLFEKVYV